MAEHCTVRNIRLTFVPQHERQPTANWAESDVIRIQAYRGDPQESQSLHRGAEIPIASEADLLALIEGLITVYRRGRL